MNVSEYALRKRNEEKLAEAKARLGEKWILHPVNRVQRKVPHAARKPAHP